jgi:hypothetical protein
MAMRTIAGGLPFLVAGTSVGLMVGLSSSPVVGGVVTASVTVLFAISSGLSGLTQTEVRDEGTLTTKRKHFDPFPIAAACLGLSIGSILGIGARTNELFGLQVDRVVARWSTSTGLSRKQISNRLFDEIYPPKLEPKEPEFDPNLPKTGSMSEVPKQYPLTISELRALISFGRESKPPSPAETELQPSAPLGRLFSSSTEGELKAFAYYAQHDLSKLRGRLINGSDPNVSRFASDCKNDTDLKFLVEDILCTHSK